MRRSAAGFSLVELAVVVALVAILSAAAAPRMTAVINANRLAGTSGELTAALQLARSEAIRRSARVTVCASADGTTCTASTAWTRWIIVGRDHAAGTDDVIRDQGGAGTVQIQGPRDGVRFNPSGLANAEQVLTTCIPTTKPADNQREIRVLVSGSVLSTRKNGGGRCP
ncbi:MAG TPA: GspH/FimT family pseudopilin [Lysobacter sp.]